MVSEFTERDNSLNILPAFLRVRPLFYYCKYFLGSVCAKFFALFSVVGRWWESHTLGRARTRLGLIAMDSHLQRGRIGRLSVTLQRGLLGDDVGDDVAAPPTTPPQRLALSRGPVAGRPAGGEAIQARRAALRRRRATALILQGWDFMEVLLRRLMACRESTLHKDGWRFASHLEELGCLGELIPDPMVKWAQKRMKRMAAADDDD